MLLLALAVAVGSVQPPAWFQRAVQGPYVTWRAADVLGTPIVEGIVVNRDAISHSVTINVVDSRFNPPRIVKLRELRGSGVRWLRAGRRDGLARNEIAIDVVAGGGGETAYLLLVRPGPQLQLVRYVRGPNLGPRTFAAG
jgi:hypothetical protein